MKKLLLALILFSIGSAVFAASDQIPRDRKITEIRAYKTSVMVKFSPSFPSTQGCSEGGSNWLYLSTNDENGRALYSTLLAVASANKTVGFGVSGCTSNKPAIYRVDVVY